MAPIRVLNLFTVMDRGGAETTVMNYYRNLDRDRVQFDFLVHRDEAGAYDAEIRELGGRIYTAPAMTAVNLRRYSRFLDGFFSDHPEYRVVHSHMSELGYFAFRKARRASVPVTICHAHNRPVGIDSKSLARFALKHLIARSTTTRFACSREAGDWLFGAGRRPSVIYMRNAVDTVMFRWDPAKAEEVRRNLGLAQATVVGSVGRFEPQKNHAFLLEVFSRVHARIPSARLVLVGTGSRLAEVKRLTSELGLDDAVLFLGARRDVADILLALDVFLFPSLFEGLPVAVVEAQASGLHCILSDAISEEVKLTDNVTFLPLRTDSNEWAAAVLDGAFGGRDVSAHIRVSEAGFDVRAQATWLAEFYLKAACGTAESR